MEQMRSDPRTELNAEILASGACPVCGATSDEPHIVTPGAAVRTAKGHLASMDLHDLLDA